MSLGKRSRRSSAATKALDAAIAEATKEYVAEIRQKDAEIGRLRGLLGRIQGIAAQAGEAVAAVAPRIVVEPPKIEEPEIPQGPSTDLSGDDNLGEGRWV